MVATRVASDARAARLFLPLAYSDEDKLYLLEEHDGWRLAFAFKCTPQAGADTHNKERLQVLLNADWPANTMIQVLLYAGPDIKPVVDHYRHLRRGQTESLLAEAVNQRTQYLWSRTDEPIDEQTGMMVRNAQLFITASIPLSEGEPSTSEIEQARGLRNHLRQTLNNAGLRPDNLSRRDYLRAMEALLSHEPDAAWRNMARRDPDDDTVLRDQVLDNDKEIEPDPEGVWIGNTRVRTLTPKRFPQSIQFGFATQYLGDLLNGARGIRGRCLYACVLHFPDPQRKRDQITRNRLFTTNQAMGPLVKFAPRLAKKKQGFDILSEACEQGDRPVHLMWALVLFDYGPTREAAEDASIRSASNAKSYLGERGLHVLQDRYVAHTIFLNTLPLNAESTAISQLFRFKTMATVHATALLPLFGDWMGNGAPLMTFVGRTGQIQPFDLFASNSNYNGLICAESGSGKSVLCNEFVMNYLSAGAQVRIIDIGYSYKHQCDLVEGQYLDFEAGESLCLNPFTIVHDYSDEEDSLVALIMAMSDPTGETSSKSDDYAVQQAELKRIMAGLWEHHGRAMCVDDVASACLNHAEGDQRVIDLGKRLYPFTSAGQYGDYFNGTNNVEFRNVMTVLELESLKGRAHLQRVVLLQLVYQIQQEMYRGGREQRRLILIDEAWEHLKQGGSAVAEFIEDCYRRARKYGGAILMAMQSISDVHGSPVGRAVAANSAFNFFLGQKDDVVEAAARDGHITMSAPAKQLLKSVRTEEGRYSEIFVQTSEGVGVARLYLEPYRLLAFANDAETPPAIERLRRQGLSTSEAINAVVEQRNQRKQQEFG